MGSLRSARLRRSQHPLGGPLSSTRLSVDVLRSIMIPPFDFFASHDTRRAGYMQYGHLMESQRANSRRRIGGGMSSRRTKPECVGLGYGGMLTLFRLGNGVGDDQEVNDVVTCTEWLHK